MKKNAPATWLVFLFCSAFSINAEQAGWANPVNGNRQANDRQAFWENTEFDETGGPFDCCKERSVWTSGLLKLPKAAQYLLSANIECVGIGEFEQDDFITISCRFDEAEWIPVIVLRDDFQRSTFSVPLNPGGERAEFKIEAETSSSDEIYKVHRLSLKRIASSTAPSFPPDPSLDSGAGMQTSHGTLIIDGGNMKREPTQATVRAFVKHAGGLDKPIVVSPTASNDVSAADLQGYINAWEKTVGFEQVSLMHSADRNPAEANTDRFVKDLKTARGLFLRGGRQWRLVDAYGNADEQSKTLKEMWALLERGGVIAGTSAGATIQGDFMPRGFTGGSGRMISKTPKHRRGFAFLPNVAIDVHVSARSRTTDLHEVLAYAHEQGDDLVGIGIDEDTAIVVQGKVFQVIGSGRVFVHTFNDSKEGDHILILTSGDRYNLSTRQNYVPAKHINRNKSTAPPKGRTRAMHLFGGTLSRRFRHSLKSRR